MQAGRGRIMQKSHSQAADKPAQLAKQAAKKPSNQADRHMQAARPTTNKRDTRSEQCNIHTASQPAKQPSSQATSQQGSHPSSQPGRQKQKPTKQKGREAHRDSNTYNQAGALLAQLHPGNTSLPQRGSIGKPLGSHCNQCLPETKHDLEAMKSK